MVEFRRRSNNHIHLTAASLATGGRAEPTQRTDE